MYQFGSEMQVWSVLYLAYEGPYEEPWSAYTGIKLDLILTESLLL